MLNRLLGGIFLILFILSPTITSGQEMPPGKWWWNQHMVKRLNLSDTEIQQLDEAFLDSRRNLIDLKRNVEREQFELEILIESKNLDENAAMEQYKRLEKAREELGVERFRFLVKIRKIVGYDSFQELMAMKKWRQKKNRMRSRIKEHDQLTKD